MDMFEKKVDRRWSTGHGAMEDNTAYLMTCAWSLAFEWLRYKRSPISVVPYEKFWTKENIDGEVKSGLVFPFSGNSHRFFCEGSKTSVELSSPWLLSNEAPSSAYL